MISIPHRKSVPQNGCIATFPIQDHFQKTIQNERCWCFTRMHSGRQEYHLQNPTKCFIVKAKQFTHRLLYNGDTRIRTFLFSNIWHRLTFWSGNNSSTLGSHALQIRLNEVMVTRSIRRPSSELINSSRR